MSEDTEIKKEELQEMARAILSEIYSSERARNGFEGLGISPKASKFGFGFDYGEFRSDGDGRLSHEQAYNLNNHNTQAANSQELYPRLSRNDFLEQRVLRRKARESVFETLSETEEGTVESSSARTASLPQADLPEKLSEIFCRDARRYDGAFEKY